MKFVVIGGNAAGMSAASRVRRKDPSWEVVVLEQTQEDPTVPAACPITWRD